MENQNITRLIALQTKINNSMNSVNKIKSLAKTAKLINFLAIKTNLSFLAKNVIDRLIDVDYRCFLIAYLVVGQAILGLLLDKTLNPHFLNLMIGQFLSR